MKSILSSLTFCLFLLSISLNAQITTATQWIWVKGDSSVYQPGVYGTMGTADAANQPGARQSGLAWTDASGNFWLFGGLSFDAPGYGYLNDLWKYNPSANQWTWIKGDNTIDQKGIYGIQGTAAIANDPGSRFESVKWTDTSGNLWLFGGNGLAASGSQSLLNDLWKYSPSANEWTWVKGDSTVDQVGIYGIQGTPAPTDKPGARKQSMSWTDGLGNFWLFGGIGYGVGGGGYLNDLWKYNPTTNEWTWVKGDNSLYQQGVYGTQGTADAANKPGARHAGVSWMDASGNLWLFGGIGYDENGNASYLNDLWRYNPSTNEWTWEKGDKIKDQSGIYGIQGTAAATNQTGAR